MKQFLIQAVIAEAVSAIASLAGPAVNPAQLQSELQALVAKYVK